MILEGDLPKESEINEQRTESDKWISTHSLKVRPPRTQNIHSNRNPYSKPAYKSDNRRGKTQSKAPGSTNYSRPIDKPIAGNVHKAASPRPIKVVETVEKPIQRSEVKKPGTIPSVEKQSQSPTEKKPLLIRVVNKILGKKGN